MGPLNNFVVPALSLWVTVPRVRHAMVCFYACQSLVPSESYRNAEDPPVRMRAAVGVCRGGRGCAKFLRLRRPVPLVLAQAIATGALPAPSAGL